MSARGITAIVYDDGTVLGGSIAAVDRNTGVMYLNKPVIDMMQLGKDAVYFIMLHEQGHMVLQTEDEEAVDEWAHKQYLAAGYSPKQSVFALTRILHFNKPEDHRRANAQLERAQRYDRN